MIPSLPYKLDRIIDFGLFVVMAIREAIKENVLHASAPHAPYDSTAKGVHRHPSSGCIGHIHFVMYDVTSPL